jgi:hypothetical protein
VLPDRIELSTSPLPMECSTTELRQHARIQRESAGKARSGRGRFLPQGPRWRKRAGTRENPQIGQKLDPPSASSGRVWADPVPMASEGARGTPGRDIKTPPSIIRSPRVACPALTIRRVDTVGPLMIALSPEHCVTAVGRAERGRGSPPCPHRCMFFVHRPASSIVVTWTHHDG